MYMNCLLKAICSCEVFLFFPYSEKLKMYVQLVIGKILPLTGKSIARCKNHDLLICPLLTLSAYTLKLVFIQI